MAFTAEALDKIEEDLIEAIRDALLRDHRNGNSHERIKDLARAYRDVKAARGTSQPCMQVAEPSTWHCETLPAPRTNR